MFFRKKRAAEKAARAAERQQILDDFDTRLTEAQGLQDPAEKILKLKKLEDDIQTSSAEVSDAANTATLMRGFGSFSMVFGPSLVGAIWLAATFANPWLLAVIIPGIWAGGKFGGWRRDRLQDRLYEENADFYKGINERAGVVGQQSAALLANDWAAIAQSPKVKEAVNAVPALREKFAAAFCNGVKESDIPTPAPVADNNNANNAVVVQAPLKVNHSLKLKRRAGA